VLLTVMVNEGIEACLLYPATAWLVVVALPELVDPVVRTNPDQIPVIRYAAMGANLLRAVDKGLKRTIGPQSDSNVRRIFWTVMRFPRIGIR
jgi:hypothetical protein